jgi:hypothetical protein
VHIVRQATTTVSDTLQLAWYGYFSTNNSGTGNLFCRLAIPKNFSYKSFTALAGQRLSINATNGYFATNITGINVSNTKGSGNIYFHSAQLDSIGPNAYSGKMSGLYDADFLSFKITKGRFDHILVPNMINF